MKNLYYCLLIAFYFSLAGKLIAQNKTENGVASSFSINAAINHKFNLNLLSTSKFAIEENEEKNNKYQPIILEIYGQALLSYSINKNWRMGVGYGFQRNNPFLDNWRNEHRLAEQVMYSQMNKNGMWYSRLRFEERWFSFADQSKDFVSRTRWQVGFAVPIISENIYWQINDEVFFTSHGISNTYFSENWAYSGIGFSMKNYGHIETGIGYDTNIDNNGRKLSLLLLQVAWSWIIHPRNENRMNMIISNRHF
jgi:hypothetical protein